MDLLMAHQSGTANSVAVSGTALTEEHIRMIKRFTETIMLSFDADPAGLKAGERGVALALTSGMNVKMVKLPTGLDPADVILKDDTLWKKALTESKHIVDFLLDYFKEKKTDDRTFRLEVGRYVLPYVADIANKIDQAHFMKEISSRLAIPEEDIRTEVEKLIKNKKRDDKDISPVVVTPAKSLKRQIEEKIIGIYLWKPDLVEAKQGYDRITGSRIDEEVKKLSLAGKNDLIFQAEMYYTEDKSLKKELMELIDNLEKEKLEEQMSGLMNDLRKAEEKELALRSLGEVGDEKEAKVILQKCHEISQRINEIKNSRFLEK